MKTPALLIAALALTVSAASQANGGIDLKQIIKQGVDKGLGKDRASANATASGAAGSAGAAPVGMPASLTGPGGPDIAGIRVGISVNEARQLLQKLNPAYKFTPITRIMSTDQVGLQAAIGSDRTDKKGADIFSLLYNEAGIVWRIKREQTVTVDKAILASTLIDSLTAKYDQAGGVVKYRDKGNTNLAWSYDLSGRQLASYSTNVNDSPCRPAPYAGSYPLSNTMYYTDKYVPTCAMTITTNASAFRTGNQNMLDMYWVDITAPPLQHDAGALNAAAAAAQQQKKNQENTVRDNKPQL
ncbi:hypothetical protein GTP81_18620 [Rugamonas sp. FT107W]|uniref:Uncharacterized protein n=1 Tax=Duganella vulcania TaxID=2692166 RepID=A0A845HK37_9BURK|nr:hypothetical protein [Duganella vulcania]MYN18767.1 hypothetical protein [Duganella vulcania]